MFITMTFGNFERHSLRLKKKEEEVSKIEHVVREFSWRVIGKSTRILRFFSLRLLATTCR